MVQRVVALVVIVMAPEAMAVSPLIWAEMGSVMRSTSGVHTAGMVMAGVHTPGMHTSGMHVSGTHVWQQQPPHMHVWQQQPPQQQLAGVHTVGEHTPGVQTSARYTLTVADIVIACIHALDREIHICRYEGPRGCIGTFTARRWK